MKKIYHSPEFITKDFSKDVITMSPVSEYNAFDDKATFNSSWNN